MRSLIFFLLLFPLSASCQLLGEYQMLTYTTDDYTDVTEGTYKLLSDERGGFLLVDRRGSVEWFHMVFPGTYETRCCIFEILIFEDGIMFRSDEEEYILTAKICDDER